MKRKKKWMKAKGLVFKIFQTVQVNEQSKEQKRKKQQQMFELNINVLKPQNPILAST